MIEGAAEHLEEGGCAHPLASWPLHQGQGVAAIPRSWVPRGSTPGSSPPEPRRGSVLDRWIEYDREHGIDEIGFGAIVLRRRTPPPENLAWTTELHAGQGSAGAQVERVFRARLDLASLDAEALLGLRLRLVAAHRLDQAVHLEDGEWRVLSTTLSATEGIAFKGEIDDS